MLSLLFKWIAQQNGKFALTAGQFGAQAALDNFLTCPSCPSHLLSFFARVGSDDWASDDGGRLNITYSTLAPASG